MYIYNLAAKYLLNLYVIYGICNFPTENLWNPYNIYTSIISTTLLPDIYVIPMTSTTVYDNYGHLQEFPGFADVRLTFIFDQY